ncbi:MAG: ABC transporter permease, partial [Gemmatimonadetes bacterium]|nr:ABC transporter permease [Gemmatimonadota bacterium]
MDTLVKDVRYAFRKMLRSPAFTAVALISLAVGIGTNAAVFALVEDFLFTDLPYQDSDDLVEIYLTQEVFPYSPLSYPDYLDVRDATTEIFEEVAAGGFTFGQVDQGDRVGSVLGELVSGSYFPLLGLNAAVGRTLLPEDDISPGAHFVVMLGFGYWQREYGGDPGVVGQTVRLNGHGYTVVGVAPEDYPGTVPGVPIEFIVPINMVQVIQQDTENPLESRTNQSYFAKGRLREGATIEGAQVVLAGVAANLRETYPDIWDDTRGFLAMPSEDVVMNPAFDKVLVLSSVLALVLVGLVLLIACANLASFLLARGTDRKKEIAMRLALGARRGTLVRQLLTETTLLAAMGGVLGLGVSIWLLKLLAGLELPLPGGISLDLGMTGKAYLFGLGVTALTGVLFGLAPALQSTNPDVAPTLKDESTGGGRPKRFTLRNLLVSGQVAASLVLLVSAGLFFRSFQAFQSEDPGFGTNPTALLTFVVSGDRYNDEEGRIFLRTYLDRLQAAPEVTAAGIISNIHMNTTSTQTLDVNVDGVEPPPGRSAWEIDQAVANSSFFQAAGIPILKGRNFQETDVGEGTRVVIINEAMSERFWPDEDPIGKVIRRLSGQELVVVGVAATTKVRTIGEAPRPFIYRAYSQTYASFLTAVIQTPGRAEDVLPVGFRVLRDMDPEMLVVENKTMAEHLGIMLFPARLGTILTSLFAVVALCLASIGLYGIVSYAVARRSREVG